MTKADLLGTGDGGNLGGKPSANCKKNLNGMREAKHSRHITQGGAGETERCRKVG